MDLPPLSSTPEGTAEKVNNATVLGTITSKKYLCSKQYSQLSVYLVLYR